MSNPNENEITIENAKKEEKKTIVIEKEVFNALFGAHKSLVAKVESGIHT